MITVKIHAGLGNQLFQYAFGWALSRKWQTKLLVDASYPKYYPISQEIPSQRYHLKEFGIPASPAFDSRLLHFTYKWLPDQLIKKIYITNLNNKICQFDLAIIKDDLALGQSHYHNISDNSYLDGFFQYPDYFEAYKKELTEIFKYKLPYLLPKEVVYFKKCKNPVIINLRRTDYLKEQNLKNQGICTLSYYQNAIKLIKENLSNPTFFLVSDDVKDSMCFLEPLGEKLIPLNDHANKEVLSDFYYLQHCRFLVLANSSYSWWAAYLNTSENKHIIAPKKWVVNPRWSDYNKTIIPREWTRI